MSWTVDLKRAQEIFKIPAWNCSEEGQKYSFYKENSTQEETNLFNSIFTVANSSNPNINIYSALAKKGGSEKYVDSDDFAYLAGLDGQEGISEDDVKLFYGSIGLEFNSSAASGEENVRQDDNGNTYKDKPIYENGIYKGKKESKYDSNGKILSIREYDDKNKFQGNATYYEYDSNGKLKKEEIRVDNHSNSSGSVQTTKIYDDKGNVIKEIGNIIGSSDGYVNEYKYDENNKLVEKVTKTSEHQSPQYIESVEKYDSTGKILESANGCGGIDTKYFYDDKGNLIKTDRYSIKYPNGDYSDDQRFSVDYHRNPILGMKISTTAYTYDKNNNLIQKVDQNMYGDIKYSNSSYNDNNQLVSINISNEYIDPYQNINNSTPIPEHSVAKVSIDPNTGEASGITTYRTAYPDIKENTLTEPLIVGSCSYDKNGKYTGEVSSTQYWGTGKIAHSTIYGADGFRDEISGGEITYKFSRERDEQGRLIEVLKEYNKDDILIKTERKIIEQWEIDDAQERTEKTIDIEYYLR